MEPGPLILIPTQPFQWQGSPLTVPAYCGSMAGLADACKWVAQLSMTITGTGLAVWETPSAREAAITAATSKSCPACALPTHRVTDGTGGTLGVAVALCGE